MPRTVTVTRHPRISLAAHHDDIALCSRLRVRTLAVRAPRPPPNPPAVCGRGRRIVEDVSPLRKGVRIAGAQKPCHA